MQRNINTFLYCLAIPLAENFLPKTIAQKRMNKYIENRATKQEESMENKVYDSFEALIGNTPLVRLAKIEKKLNLKANLYAKVEGLNPAGSIKDRAALYMIKEAQKDDQLKDGATIIEPTSGNTGIGLCAICAMYGYRAIIVMPSNMSQERILTMQAYGAQVVLTPAEKGMKGAIEKATELLASTPVSFCPNQFSNPANALAHELTTGPEIWNALGGKIDIFVAGVGTGGTITGVARYLKAKNSKAKIVAVEPTGSPFLSQGKAGRHGLQGIGAGFQPQVLDKSLLNEILTCTEKEAYTTGRMLCQTEAIFAGISSGAALAKAIELAQKEENAGKNIVVILPDNGDRYLSTPLFQKEQKWNKDLLMQH